MTAGVGVAIAVLGAVLARPFLTHAFGAEYVGVAHLVGPYLLAMALLGVVRVQVARRGAAGDGRLFTVVAIVGAIAAEIVGIVGWARSVDAVVVTTLFSTAGLAVVLEMPHLAARSTTLARRSTAPVPPGRWGPWPGCARSPSACACATTRGLWVDEAISVGQAQLPFGQMLDRHGDDRRPPAAAPRAAVGHGADVRDVGARRAPAVADRRGGPRPRHRTGSGASSTTGAPGWVAAMLAAIAPFCVWYSQEARMYALFMLLAAVAVGAQVQAIQRGRTVDWVLYGLATVAHDVDAVLRRPARSWSSSWRSSWVGAAARATTGGAGRRCSRGGPRRR